MSKRILHLASFNHLLKHEYADFTCPDPLALVNLADLIELAENKAIIFLQHVLSQYRKYNPIDDISIRTAVSCEEESRKRPFKLYLKPEAQKENAECAYEICKMLLAQNPNMNPSDAWLIFAMCNPEVFSGNVSSDYYWPEKIIMEVTQGPYATLAYGYITRPESYVLEKRSEQIHFHRGNNSPIISKFLGNEISMNDIKRLMKLAAARPCTLEFVYGTIRKIGRTAPLIFDVRVPKDNPWKFYDTCASWETESGQDFLCKFNLISNIALKRKAIESLGESTLEIGPSGSIIKSNQEFAKTQELLEIAIFSPWEKPITIEKLNPSKAHVLEDYFRKVD